MKRITLLIALVAIAMPSMAQDVINYFEVSSNIAKPVTIKTGKGTYTIYGGERIDGNLGWLEAYDAHGKQIVNTTPYKTETGTNQPTIRYYRFSTLYDSETNTTQTKTNNNNSTNSDWGTELGRAMSDYAHEAMKIRMEGYPNLQMRVGWSKLMKEYIGLHTELGGVGGYFLAGMVGEDLTLEKNMRELKWMAEIGYYGGDNNNTVNFGIIIGKGFFIGADLQYSHWFSSCPRLGLFAAGQWGGQFTDGGNGINSVWEFRFGLSFKLFTD